jgi:3-hydroxyisobutyrate dehydrogenase-like beta-hydroxyacid dehydrogenase
VRQVYLDSTSGVVAASDISGKLFIDCSTIDIATSLLIGRKLQEHYLQSHASNNTNLPNFFDAPVSGGTAGAAKGALTIMLGCAADSPRLPLLKQIMSTMGTNIYTLGGPSLGLAAKLSNNYLSGMIALATSEAMNLGMRLGIEPKMLQKVFSTSSGGSWVNDTVNPVPGVCPDAVTSKGYEGGFKVRV